MLKTFAEYEPSTNRRCRSLCRGFELRSHSLNVFHGVVDVRGRMDSPHQPSSAVATRPPYSLQITIGSTRKMRDIRLECGYSAKELVDLLGYVSVFIHRIISGLGALNITKTSSTVTVVERDGLRPFRTVRL
jgi:hypothetical protein